MSAPSIASDIEGDERRGRLFRQLRHARRRGMQSQLQGVEVEAARRGDDDLAVDDAVVREDSRQQRVVQLGKVPIERPQVAALDEHLAAAAKDDGAKAVPLRLVEERAAGRQRVGELREHRLDGRCDGKGHRPSVKRVTLRRRGGSDAPPRRDAALLAATFFTQSSSAQTQNTVRNDLPQPYRTTRDWGQLPPGVVWAAVTAVEPAPDGTIYVIHRCFENSCAGRKEDADPQVRQERQAAHGWGAGMFIFPHGATVDRDGNLWVTDARGENGKGHQVFKFNPDGKVLMTLGKAGVSGSGADLFDQPTDVVVAPDGTIFVTDSHRNGKNNRVVKLTKDGKYIKEWGTKGSGPGQISEPHTIAMDSQGRSVRRRSREQPHPDLRSGGQVHRRVAAVRTSERHLDHALTTRST